MMLEKILFYKDKIAVVHKTIEYSFGELAIKIEEFFKQIISRNILPGETVVILGDYSFSSIALFLALYKRKAILVPITSNNENEVQERIRECNPNWVWNLKTGELNEKLENRALLSHPLIEKIQNAPASGLILFSSGSTGKPKSMVHNLDNLVSSYQDRKAKAIVFLIFLMFDHIGGLNTLLNCLAIGATIVIPESRKPEEICTLIEKYRINILPSSPTFLNLLLISGAYEKFDLSSLKMITYGTEPMPEALLHKLKVVFKGVKFLQTFGTSETGIVKTQSKSSSSTFLKFEDTDQEYKIVNNELWLRSKTQILGYMNYSNENFTSDGWFKTGDIVEQTADHFIKIVGRAKEMINVGGEKVLPEEVEAIILELAEVRDCLVYGIKNAITGQMVAANIVLAEGFDPKELKPVIKKYCQQKMASYKVPVKINMVDNIGYTDRFKKVRNGSAS